MSAGSRRQLGRTQRTRTDRDGEGENGCGVSHGVYDFPVCDVVHLDHLVETSTEQPTLARSVRAVKREAGHRLLVVADLTQTAPSADEIPASYDGPSCAENEPSRRVRQDGLDGVVGLERHLGLAGSGVPQLDRRVVRSRQDLMRGGGEERA